MSSIYQQLSDKELKFGKEAPRLAPTDSKNAQPPLGLIKAAIALAFLLSLAALVGAGTIYQSLNSEKRQRQALEAAQFQLQEKANSLGAESGQYRNDISRMRDQLQSYISERNELKSELDKSRVEITTLQKKIQELEARSAAVEEQTKKLQEQAAEQEAGAAAGAIPGVDALLDAGPSKDQEAEAKLEPKVIAKTHQILTVNHKFNFVVVNVGLKDDVKIGDTLSIERNGKTVGKVQVEKLYENFSAATILQEPKKDSFQEGDIVRKPS